MKVGDYVRIDGIISKIIDINNKSFERPCFSFDDFPEGYRSLSILEGSKTSPNIIDLIEVGDYVNGKKVIDTFTDYIFDYSEEFKVIRFSETDILHDKRHIKSIVTKKQFESMEYKVGGRE